MNLINHLLEYDTIALQCVAPDWKEAVKIGTDLLVRAGMIEPRYYDEIIKNTELLGPYYLLAPGLAMPHARPEGGVIENSFSLVTLKNPVNFGDPDNDPIDILITMAAKDSESQNKGAIVQVVTLLDDEDLVSRLKKVSTIEAFKSLFQSSASFISGE